MLQLQTLQSGKKRFFGLVGDQKEQTHTNIHFWVRKSQHSRTKQKNTGGIWYVKLLVVRAKGDSRRGHEGGGRVATLQKTSFFCIVHSIGEGRGAACMEREEAG
jgi:hypothetical protein